MASKDYLKLCQEAQNKKLKLAKKQEKQIKQKELRAKNETETEIVPPQTVEPEQKTQQEPLNTDIDNKPVEQEPNVDGPVVNEPVNAQNSSADELMSNDEFRKMLQRNLDITNQEKQRRLNRKNQSNLK